MDVISLANKIRQYGFSGTQLVFAKALNEPVDFQNLEAIKQAFSGLQIMMLGAYFNPIHPDKEIVAKGIRNFKEHLQVASLLEAPYVGSETGSLMGSPWGYVPENHTDASLMEIIEVFQDLVKEAALNDVAVAIEGAWQHVVYSPERMRQVLDLIPGSHLQVTVDLYNYLHMGNYNDRISIFQRCFDLFADRIRIIHLKDFMIENNQLKQVGLGQGMMEWPILINLIKKYTPDASLIFEGVTGEDIITSYDLISNLLKEV
ncbi:MAG: sugar phosphate isomerase/epimerase [Bacilli bacterium]|nr:sugar phosphate isomerase/epimerase [Bacilli bacterium]